MRRLRAENILPYLLSQKKKSGIVVCMQKHIYLLFISTFVFGAITGVIFLLQTKSDDDGFFNASVETRGFFVSARMYGGCMRGGVCASYSIEPNGSYTYLRSNVGGSEQMFESKLTKDNRAALEKLVKSTSFSNIKGTQFTGACPVLHDGIAYTFHIVYNGDAYDFDSCREDLLNTETFQMLVSFFDVFLEANASQS